MSGTHNAGAKAGAGKLGLWGPKEAGSYFRGLWRTFPDALGYWAGAFP